MVRKLFYILALVMFVSACGPKYVEKPAQAEFPVISFTPILPYKVNLDFPKIPKPKKMYFNKDFKEVKNASEAQYVVLYPSEYAKYVAKLEEIRIYKDMIKKQEELVNTYIRIINGHKEFLELERAKAQAYRNMWVDSENAYRDERYGRQLDGYYYKGLLGAISIGSLIAFILLL